MADNSPSQKNMYSELLYLTFSFRCKPGRGRRKLFLSVLKINMVTTTQIMCDKYLGGALRGGGYIIYNK